VRVHPHPEGSHAVSPPPGSRCPASEDTGEGIG
jgi:hypothetical protein